MLTRGQKIFFKKEFYIILVGFLFGLWVWLSLFRVVQVVNEEETSYLFLSLKEVKKGDEVVFYHPNLSGPLRVSKTTQNKKGEFMVSLNEEKTEVLNEDLAVGVVLFRF